MTYTTTIYIHKTIKVENTGGYNYKFTIDSFDDNGNKIQGTFEAVLDATYEQNFD